MNYWIGVLGSKITCERFFMGADSWCCMPKSCEDGDIVLMYSSKKATGVKSGIFASCEIANKDELKDGECRRSGIFSGSGERPIYVDLKLLDKFQQTNFIPIN